MRHVTAPIPAPVKRGWNTFRQAQRLAAAGNGHRIRLNGLRMFVETLHDLKSNDAGLLAAGVAYYAVLSLVPLALAMWGILGLFADSADVTEAVESFFAVYLPNSSVSIVDEFQSADVATSGIAGIAGLLSLLWVGSAMFSAISRTINRAFAISQRRPFYLARPRALALGLTLFLLFAISVYSSVVIESLANFNVPVIGNHVFLQALAHIPPLMLTLATFSIAYKMLPNTATRWAYILPVAVVASTVFEAAKFGFAIYLNRFASYDEVYGSIASVIVLMVWSYTSAYIVIAGGHAAAVYTRIRERLPARAPAELHNAG